MTQYALDDPALKIPYRGDDIATPALQALFDRLQNGDKVHVPLATDLVLDQPLRWSDRAEVDVQSDYQHHYPGSGGPRIRYVGPPDVAVLEMDRTRYCTLHGIDFDSGHAATVINIDGHTPGHIGTECEIAYCAAVNATQRDDWTFLYLSKTARENQEYHRSVRNYIRSVNNTGCGVRVGPSANAKHTDVVGGTYERMNQALLFENGGCHLDSVNFTDNTYDLYTHDCQNASTDHRSKSESSRHHLGFDGAGSLVVSSGRFSVEATEHGTSYHEFGVNASLTFRDNTYDTPVPDGTTLYSGVTNRGLALWNNTYSGAGMTLQQLGLEIGVGKWIAAEWIKDAPFGAFLAVSSHWNDGTAALLNTMTMGQGTPDELRLKGPRRLTISLPKGDPIKPRSSPWYVYPVPGLTPDDVIMDVVLDSRNAVSVIERRVTAPNTLALKYTNPTASLLTPPSGACELLVLRIAAPG